MKNIGLTENKLYFLAGAMAILIALAGLTDALSSMGIDARDNRSIPAAAWFALFQSHWFEAFSRLGVINMITLTLGIPIYVGFCQAFRRQKPALVALAAALFITGVVIYLSSNTVFPLYALSQQYAAAPADEKLLLEAAGSAMLAQGADLTPGTFIGLFFTQAAGLLVAGSMLRGTVFGRWTGGLGLTGFSLMTVFFVLTAFFPEHYSTAMLVSAPGGLLLLVYQGLLARRFFQLGRGALTN